jgi:hypothetical protein
MSARFEVRGLLTQYRFDARKYAQAYIISFIGVTTHLHNITKTGPMRMSAFLNALNKAQALPPWVSHIIQRVLEKARSAKFS